MKHFLLLQTTLILCITTLVGSMTLPQFALAQSFSERFQQLLSPAETAYRIVETKIPVDEFWEKAKSLGKRVLDYAAHERHEFVEKHPEITQRVKLFEQSIQQVAQECSNFVATFEGMDREMLSEKWDMVVENTANQIQREFPPLKNATHHEQRERDVHRVLELIENQMVIVLGPHLHFSEAVLRERFGVVRKVVTAAVVATGDIAELHPQATEMLLFSAVAMMLPESTIVRGLLRLVGFGPDGPLKGSVAAWAQRRFYGQAVKAGSWFARLQTVAMTKGEIIKPIWKVIGSIGLGGAVAGSFSLCGGGGR